MQHNFRDLDVWKKSIGFVSRVYTITNSFPSSELYGIVSQMQRAAISIPSNIAEGAGRDSNSDFSRFISIAEGSAYEIETQITIAHEILYLNDKDYNSLLMDIQEIQRMLSGLKRSLQ